MVEKITGYKKEISNEWPHFSFVINDNNSLMFTVVFDSEFYKNSH